jgi:hypothetical protein
MVRLKTMLSLNHGQVCLLLETSFWLAASRLALLAPFSRVAPYLGRHMAESSSADVPDRQDFLRDLSWALGLAGRHLPWTCRCLVRAMAGKRMLDRRGIPSTLYLGLAKEGEMGLKAHAWLRSGPMIVTGAEVRADYQTIASFSG